MMGIEDFNTCTAVVIVAQPLLPQGKETIIGEMHTWSTPMCMSIFRMKSVSPILTLFSPIIRVEAAIFQAQS